MCGSSHTSKSRMGTRGCGRGYAPETGNGTWGVSPGPSSAPVSCKDSGSQWTYLDSHHGRLGSTAGTPPCLAFPWTALPSSTICISCHLMPPQPRAQPPRKASASCVLTCGAQTPSPLYLHHVGPTHRISTDLLLTWSTQHPLLGMPTTTTFLWLYFFGPKNL